MSLYFHSAQRTRRFAHATYYLGVPDRVVATSKDGKEIVPTMPSTQISLQSEILEMLRVLHRNSVVAQLIGVDNFKENVRLLKEDTVVEEIYCSLSWVV